MWSSAAASLSALAQLWTFASRSRIALLSASKAVGMTMCIVVMCIWAYVVLTGEPRLPIGIANGSYSNRCCGTLIVADGVMTFGDQRVSYMIERDKTGPYILPKTYVGASKQGFVFRPSSYPLKLRLDNTAHPQKVELLDDGPSGEAYSFVGQ